MARTFKALSAVLSYPTRELQAAIPELHAVMAGEGLIKAALLRGLDHLLDEIAEGDIYDCQERYVFLFDRTRSLSLHLFEHVHGEGRDRGQAMIDLKALYEKGGLAISASELPDFLPLFLEFLSTQPLVEARDLLSQTAHILEALALRLEKRESDYAAIFRALLALAAAEATGSDLTVEDINDDPMNLDAIDAEWEEEPVTFGPETSSCRDGLVARLRAAKRTVNPARPGD